MAPAYSRRVAASGPNGTCTRPRVMEGVWATMGRDVAKAAVAGDLPAAACLHPPHGYASRRRDGFNLNEGAPDARLGPTLSRSGDTLNAECDAQIIGGVALHPVTPRPAAQIAVNCSSLPIRCTG